MTARALRAGSLAARSLHVAAIALALWAVIALGLAVAEASKRPEQALELNPSQWQLGGPQEDRLGKWLARVDRRLPYGSIVRVETPRRAAENALALYLFTAYTLPRHRVFAPGVKPPAEPRPEYLVMIGAGAEDQPATRGELLELSPVGALVRLVGSDARGEESSR